MSQTANGDGSSPRSRATGQRRSDDVSLMVGWVLVADRDAEDRMLLFHLLEKEGHRATVVDDGRDELTLLRAEPFDLALVDMFLPSPDGEDLVRAVKRDPRLSHIPLIATTEGQDSKDVDACLDLGADDYLPKPVDPRLLRARVNAGLAKKRLHNLGAGDADQVRELVEAAARIGTGAFDSTGLEHLSRRTDACGHLARALLRTAALVQEREQRLRGEMAFLHRQLNATRRADA